MSKVKKSWITIISLLAALFLILGLGFGLPRVSVFANTYAPSSVFAAGTGGTVGASEKEEGNDDAKAFVQFSFNDGGKVHFRRDLALKWYSDKDQVRYFSMQFAFGEINFEKFTIDFESAEENISKDGKATNSITFVPNAADDTKLDVFVNKTEEKTAEGEETEPVSALVSVDKTKDVLISFDETDCEIGEFNVYVENAEPQADLDNEGTETAAVNVDKFAGKFVNIGGYFMEYRSSSSSTPNTPITFTAVLPADAESGAKQTLLMKSLNGQNFELDSSNRVVDNAPAVLVLNEQVYAFKLGQRFSLSYEAIDVCDDNVTVTREYYMLKSVSSTDPDAPGETYYMPNDKEWKGEGNEEYEPYNFKSLTTSTYFLPSQENSSQQEFVAIRFKLDDDTDENDTYAYLSWYAAGSALESKTCTGYEEVGEGDEKKIQEIETPRSYDFIKVERNQKGPRYTYLTAGSSDNTEEEGYNDAVNAYKEALAVAASETSAGTGAYIYLPSLRGLINSDFAGYRNLKFSIFYYGPRQDPNGSASSQTSLNYNALKLEVTENGIYTFRVLAQDAASNGMEYNLNGELVTVSSSNIWDIEGIPEFTFEITYDGPTIEKTEEQSLGYRNDTYTFKNFDIVALSGYETEYTLYRYDSSNVPSGVNAPSSYSDFVENAADYFNAFKELDDNPQTDSSKKILREINVYQDDISSDDEAKWNRTDNDYYWDPDSALSFVPQEAGFYILKLLVQDNKLRGETAEAFQVIEVRNPIDTIPGQSQWLEENVVSVVLFAISGVLAIVVVVLFLVKPSEKKVEEIDLEKLKGKKKNKTEKKK